MPACRRHYPGGTVGCICRPLPQRWQPSLYSRQVGFRIQPFEACSAFTHYGLHARRVTKMTRYIVGFDALVISFIATIATGWSDLCRVGLTPTERPCLRPAHPNDVVSISRLKSRYAQYHRICRSDVARDDRLERCCNVTSDEHRINSLFGTGTM